MAEFVMKDLVQKAGLASQFHIESAATSREEIGNPVYPPARRKLAEHGISCEGHAARQLTNLANVCQGLFLKTTTQKWRTKLTHQIAGFEKMM